MDIIDTPTGGLTRPAEPATDAALPPTGTLRFATAGSVDDGKSTLVGRLLHDSKSVLADQLAAVEAVSRQRGRQAPDLALLTDGLRAEREQGITIDVAHRYFATPRRRFILADTPGHVQYTRNMVTGASTADLALVLVDARHGVVEQTRRHLAVAALLCTPQVTLVVNKMDLVGHSEQVFADIAAGFARCARSLGVRGVTAIPVSALDGDNVVRPSDTMGWYAGPTVLEHLETVPSGVDPRTQATRLPVQYVIRPQSGVHRDYRGYAGQLTSGVLRVGDRVTALPAGLNSTITAIDTPAGPAGEARAPQSVTVRLADDIDVSRGDLLAPVAGAPRLTRRLTATVCHLTERPLRPGQRVLLRHTSRTVRAVVESIDSRLDLRDLAEKPGATTLEVNDIGRITVRTAEPLALDGYTELRRTGAFLLIDPEAGDTLTAGMADAPEPEHAEGA
ncbi:GTP-binding protein [Streptomyces calidiresistens]|uniref:sulfate adenylyltransferase n=1 Tax=Streptomyces calidiresistens TaxID=1485586 RepID=A0A7W3T291_9ACTN|nr:GTP-binding protein [Streptomyces calidiresistens]MBB0229468.1 sulfate adenylyltransferase [Streptomyces calidiresistens]